MCIYIAYILYIHRRISAYMHVSICCCSLFAQSCPTLCNPIDCSPPDFPVHRISQAKILEWVAISFSRGSFRSRDHTCISCIAGGFFTTEPPGKPMYLSVSMKVKVKFLSRVRLFATPWTAACQASSLSITNSWSLLKFISIELVMQYCTLKILLKG